MALTKINVGTNEDGSPRWHFQADEGTPVVITGPITGSVSTADGTVYDVSAPVIEVASDAHAAEVAAAIGDRFAAEGHPDHSDGQPFVHVPVEG